MLINHLILFSDAFRRHDTCLKDWLVRSSITLNSVTMPTISCPRCDYVTPESPESIAVAVFNAHVTSHMPTSTTTIAPAAPTAPRGPKLERPMVDVGVSLEEWNVFTRRLDAFVIGSGLDPQNYSSQLFQCAGKELGDAIPLCWLV